MKSKWNVPYSDKPAIERERLYKNLDAGILSGSVLVCGTAGSGKTTLAASWLKNRKGKAAWYCLDDTDNDAVSVIRNTVKCIESCYNTTLNGFSVLAEAASDSQSNIGSIEITAAFLSELEEQKDDYLIIFDDYHTVTSQSVHESFQFILNHPPDNLRMLILSRSALPFPVSRLKTSGKLAFLNSEDLAFTLDETGSLLTRDSGKSPERAVIEQIHNSTGGWGIAVQLSGLSLGNGKSPHLHTGNDGIQELSGFLMEEIMESMEPDFKYLLHRISPADYISPDLFNFLFTNHFSGNVSREISGIEFIHNLLEKNLFLSCTDQQEQLYRLHDFFRQFLMHQLDREAPFQKNDIQKLISEWYFNNKQPEEALEYAFRAADADKVSLMIEEVVKRNSDNRILFRYKKWLDTSALEKTSAASEVALHKARIHLHSGEINQVFENLIKAEVSAAFTQNPARTIAKVTAMQAAIALYGGKHAEVIQLTGKALDNISGPEDRLYSICLTYFAISSLLAGKIQAEKAIELLGDAERAGAVAGDWIQSYSAGFQKAVFMSNAGMLEEALNDHRKRIQEIESRNLPFFGILGNSYSETGYLLSKTAPDEDCLSLVDKGYELSQASCSVISIWWSMFARLRVLSRTDDRKMIEQEFEQVFRFEAEHTILPWFPELTRDLHDDWISNLDDSAKPAKKVVNEIAFMEELSQREKEVIVCLSEGYSNFQILETLFISINTVKTHLKNINGKLGAANRTQAVHIAREAGIC